MPGARLAPTLVLVPFLLGASVLAQSAPDADAAATKFLIEDKGLATAPLPAEQWLGTYAGPCWTASTVVSVVEHDEGESGLRKITTERIVSRDPDAPGRESCSWWIDATGAIVKGERRTFEEGSSLPQELVKLTWNGRATVRLEVTSKDASGKVQKSDPVESPVPASFVPDPLLAIVLLPASKGTTWRFQTWGPSATVAFTISDEGAETIRGRHGPVTARKVVLREPEGELTSWVDDEKKIVCQRWSYAPDLVSIAGTDSESRTDWVDRPQDEADANAARLATGLASLAKLSGEISYGIHDRAGHARDTYHASITRESRAGKSGYHYMASTAAVATTTTTAEEWWLEDTGGPVSGKSTYSVANDSRTTTASVESATFVLRSDDAPKGKESARFPVAPHFVPDALLLLRAVAREEKGAFRFSGMDLRAETPYSIYLVVEGTDQVKGRAAPFLARRIRLHQNSATALCWVDVKGSAFVVQWADGDLFVSGSVDETAKDLAGPVGPLGKDK